MLLSKRFSNNSTNDIDHLRFKAFKLFFSICSEIDQLLLESLHENDWLWSVTDQNHERNTGRNILSSHSQRWFFQLLTNILLGKSFNVLGGQLFHLPWLVSGLLAEPLVGFAPSATKLPQKNIRSVVGWEFPKIKIADVFYDFAVAMESLKILKGSQKVRYCWCFETLKLLQIL